MSKTFFKSALILTLFLSPAFAGRETEMPDFVGIAQWLNTDKPVTKESLKGKVVLVDFWAYSCINCIRTLPHVNSWYADYKDQGLVVVGVHAPEFEFEKDPENVQRAITKYGIAYPVGLDNNLATWRAYLNQYWPAHYLVDRNGRVRYTHFGEGEYDVTEKKIRELLAEGGAALPVKKKRNLANADLSKVKTPEIYLGYSRLEFLGNPEEIKQDQRQNFAEPKKFARGKFYLAGDWRVTSDYAVSINEDSRLLLRYEADKANMVADTTDGHPVTVGILIDGLPATLQNKGKDVTLESGRSFFTIREPRLYMLTNGAGGVHTVELRLQGSGARIYTFTFGHPGE